MIGSTLVKPLLDIPCQQKYLAAAAAGGLVMYYNLDTLLVSRGVPKVAHYALAGMLVESICGTSARELSMTALYASGVPLAYMAAQQVGLK